jgi:HlyD family secretion protein
MADQSPTTAPPNPDDRLITASESAQAASELQAFKALEGRAARRKRSQRLRIAIIIVVVVFVIGGGYMLLKKRFAPQQEVPVVTDVVFRGNYSDSIRASGNLKAYEQVTITPEVDGTIAELHIAEGDTVEAGQLLFTIDNPDLDKAITQAQRGVDSANLALRGAQNSRNEAGAAVDKAWADYQNVKKAYEESLLLDPEDPLLLLAPTQESVDMAYELYKNTQSMLDAAKLNLENAQMGVSDAQTFLNQAIEMAEKRKVYSPISGQVVVMNLERGMRLSTLATSGRSPVQIADVSKMRMTVSINELDILNISPGMKAQVNVNALFDYVAEAEVLRVASTSGSGDYYYYGPGGGLVTYEVDLVIPSPDPRLKIGMSAEAEIVTEFIENVLLVNSMAIQGYGEFSYLVVLDAEGSERQVTVTVIANNYSVAVIEGDIKEGDEVVIRTGGGMGGGSIR